MTRAWTYTVLAIAAAASGFAIHLVKIESAIAQIAADRAEQSWHARRVMREIPGDTVAFCEDLSGRKFWTINGLEIGVER